MFIQIEDRYAFLDTKDLSRYTDTLPAGVYTAIEMPFQPLQFEPISTRQDGYVPLSSNTYHRVRSEVNNFFNPEITEKLKGLDIMHKRGVILYGPPGTGKSAFALDLCKVFVENGAIVLMQPELGSLEEYVNSIRTSAPDVTIVVVWDEFDSVVRYAEEELLRITDGVKSIDNLFIIGMTNNIRNINDRIKNRPSRFGLVVELGNPEEVDRRNYIMRMFTTIYANPETVETIVKITQGKSLDHLKECCIQYSVVGTSLDELKMRMGYIEPLEDEEEDSDCTDDDNSSIDVLSHISHLVSSDMSDRPNRRRPTPRRRVGGE